jgi:hypothetical protein
VPGRGEFSARVPADKRPGDKVELEVTGQGLPLVSMAQRPMEVAHRPDNGYPVLLSTKHSMYQAVVPKSAMLDNRFNVDVPGRGEVEVMLPPGKQPGDEVNFPLPPADVRLRKDTRPGMAQIMSVINEEQKASATQPRAVAVQSQEQQPTLQQPKMRFDGPPHVGHPPRRAQEPQEAREQEVRVTVPDGAVPGTNLAVRGSGGGEYEVTVPAGVKAGGSFFAMLPAEPAAPQPAAAMRSSGARTTVLAGQDLSDAVTSAVTDAVQDAVQQAAKEAAAEQVAAAPTEAPAEAPAAEAAPAAEEPAAEAPAVEAAPVEEDAPVEAAPVGQVEVVAPQPAEEQPEAHEAEEDQSQEGLGHRDAEDAFNKGEAIEAQAIPNEYEGEAIMAPDSSTNQYTVTVYEPMAKKGRRNRGIASTWNPDLEVRLMPVCPCALHAWLSLWGLLILFCYLSCVRTLTC